MAKEGWTYEDLRSSLKKKEFASVYLLYGEEDFLVDEAADLVLDTALTKDERGFNLDVMYGSESDARDIISRASSFPMMAARRVVIVREFDKLPAKELLTSYIEHPSESTCLVLLSIKPDFRKKPFLTVRRNGRVIEFKPLYENHIASWISTRAKKEGYEIDQDAGKLLATYVGTSLREIQGEMQKLFVYAGERKSVGVDDVMAVVGVSREYNIFELQKAIGSKSLDRSIFIMQRMIKAGESPTTIIVMLTRFFTMLWRLHDMRRRGVPQNEQSAKLGVNPYFLKDYTEAASHFSAGEIGEVFVHLADADLEMKSSSQDPSLLMHLVLLKMFSVAAQAGLAGERR